MNKKNTYFHLLHYLILFCILSTGFIIFFFFRGYPSRQFGTVFITSFAYFIWGIVHHRAEGDLHTKVMIEYLLIALMAVFLLKGAVFR